jgi:16S rRNA (adenine1518-N6/adenine1519-N6)-dimethyltransferase
MALLDREGLRPRKRFGQNFLVDRDARRRIIDGLEPDAGDLVWEIGAGLGALTGELCERAGRVVCFEIDHGFVTVLRNCLPRDKAIVVAGDVSKTWRAAMDEHGIPDLIVANLPYNIAGLIMGTMLEEGPAVRRAVYTVQREVADRVCAAPGSKHYGSFSVFCRLLSRPEKLRNLSPQSFYPRPNVHSAVVRLHRRAERPDGKRLTALLRASFGSRRKTLINNLLQARYPSPDMSRVELERVVESIGLSTQSRPEELEPASFARLLSVLEV